MRKIRLRCYDMQTDKMYSISDDGEQREAVDRSKQLHSYFFNNAVQVMEYIGIQDIDGIDICECDIVSHEGYCDDYTDYKSGTAIIKWDEEEAGFYAQSIQHKDLHIDIFNLTKNLRCKVIGNIYQIKELLEVKQPQEYDKVIYEGEYFKISEHIVQNRKTPILNIFSNYGYCLGEIKWYGPWRKFCFYPEKQTIWDNKCLNELQTFLSLYQTSYKQKTKGK